LARRRIAFFTPMHFGADAYVGGGERYPLNLARGLVAADPGLEVEVLGMGPVARREALQPRLAVRVLPITAPAASPLDHLSGDLAGALEAADVVHVHQAFIRSSQVALLTAKFLGLPVALTDHGAMTNRTQDVVRHVDLADLVVFQSEFARGQVTVSTRSTVIPGGIDARFFRPAEAPVARRHVLFVGRLLPHKGVDLLLAALPRDVPLVVVGRPYDPGYAAYVRALAARRDVRFVHDADDLTVRELYRGALATVLFSTHHDAWGMTYEAPELMGMTGLESMACGTPAIVSRAGALAEFVEDGVTGFVCGSLGELAGRLEALADGRVSADALGATARRRVEERFGLDVVGARLAAAYDQHLPA
jgi:glycosyltransferase involved in cell wall biosynthesis